MSLESALDEERREVLNLLEGRPANHGISGRSPPAPIRTSSPNPPVRSMLDIDVGAPRHMSVASANPGAPSPLRSAPLTGSMLDPYSPPPTKTSHNAGISPSEGSSQGLHRTHSDASAHAPRRPRAGSDTKSTLPYSKDQFDMTSTVSGQAMPKRVTQGGKKISSMASIMQGQELDPVYMPVPRDRGRHNSTAGILGPHSSRSPSSRLNRRSDSPGTSILNNNSFNPMPLPNKFLSDSGKVIDLSTAYRKLSDANFIKAGSNLSAVSEQDSAARARLDSGEILSPTGEIRLQKDYYEDGEDAVESSDEGRTSEEEAWGARGRRRSRKKKGTGGNSNEPSPLPVQSLLAAAEEERESSQPAIVTSTPNLTSQPGISVSNKYQVKSMLEPDITVTGPSGERLPPKKSGVHPTTNYNTQLSRSNSPGTSDSEDLGDIKRAQKLSIHSSPIDSSGPHRVIRTILRGEFPKMQQEGEKGSRRLRTYLVATDLSSEAAYALEWTIGTVLRDGDTLLSMYCVDEETMKSCDKEPSTSLQGLPDGQGGAAIQDTAATMAKLTEIVKATPASHVLSPLSHGLDPVTNKSSRSRQSSVDARSFSRTEQDRFNAIEDISQTCIRFLRKTKLQVRIAVEVIHCKSSKHMITEAVSSIIGMTGIDRI